MIKSFLRVASCIILVVAMSWALFVNFTFWLLGRPLWSRQELRFTEPIRVMKDYLFAYGPLVLAIAFVVWISLRRSSAGGK